MQIREYVGFGGFPVGVAAFGHYDAPDTIQRLREFRNELHMLFGKRADALFEMCDAAIAAGPSPSLAYLSGALAVLLRADRSLPCPPSGTMHHRLNRPAGRYRPSRPATNCCGQLA